MPVRFRSRRRLESAAGRGIRPTVSVCTSPMPRFSVLPVPELMRGHEAGARHFVRVSASAREGPLPVQSLSVRFVERRQNVRNRAGS